jgi:hypothetical protein
MRKYDLKFIENNLVAVVRGLNEDSTELVNKLAINLVLIDGRYGECIKKSY